MPPLEKLSGSVHVSYENNSKGLKREFEFKLTMVTKTSLFKSLNICFYQMTFYMYEYIKNIVICKIW